MTADADAQADPAGPAAGELPVVLVHGALRGRLGLVPTAWMLRRRGLNVRVFGYATRRDSLAEHGEALARFLDGWLGERRPEVLGFVTHSMGGLVVRAYLAQGAARHSARQRVVMLSPPNRGATLAAQQAGNPAFRWLYGRAASELHPDRVADLPPLPDSADVLVLAGGRGDPRGYNPKIEGDDDGVVALADMPVQHSGTTIEPELVGGIHGLLQWRGAVMDRATRFLRNEPADEG